MNFDNLIHDHIGLIHLIFSILALITGTMVLVKKKGDRIHKKIGYAYTFAMAGVLVTAFMLYHLFGKFGIFHILAIVSTLTILAGMIPIWRKKPNNYISLHYNFMYWSVFGLYGAFMAEIFVRLPDVVIESGIPNTVFYNMTGIAVGVTMGLGYFFMFRKRKDWEGIRN